MVFIMIILNNNKYSGHYTISWFPTSKSGVANASVKLKSSVRHVCL